MKYLAISILAFVALAACGDREVLLEGERLSIAGVETEGEHVNRADPLALPSPVTNGEWTHLNGNVRHQLPHPALGRNLKLAWSADVGQGNDRKHRITADPIIADGIVFTLDSRSLISAHSTAGALQWTRDLTQPSENADDASGGGLAAANGTIYATSGFGTLSAMDARTGALQWVQDLDSSATGAPTVFEGVVYLVTRNAVGWAIDTSDGRILWQINGENNSAGIAGGPSPTVAGPLVIFPFSSGQMVAAVRGTGTQAWAVSVAGERTGRSFSRYSDLTGEPVVVGNTVFAANHSGRSGAFDAPSGATIWSANEGATDSIWVVGGSVFMVSDENRLVRLDAANGDVVWAVDLPFFRRERIKKRKATFAHFGPVLAGGRLLLASDDEWLREFDPVTGALISASELSGKAASNPVVAGQTMYIVTDKGELSAFR